LNAFITGIFALLADAGTVVNVNVAEKLAQLKNQVATLEKREER
jgi:mitotic spindle assembly checkpoint protein MAD1